MKHKNPTDMNRLLQSFRNNILHNPEIPKPVVDSLRNCGVFTITEEFLKSDNAAEKMMGIKAMVVLTPTAVEYLLNQQP